MNPTTKKSKSVTLKRTVTIKAIVTEEFKKYLKQELNQAISDLDAKLNEVLKQGSLLVEQLKAQGQDEQVNVIQQQMDLDRQQQGTAKSDLEKRIQDAELLALGSEFVQGTIDGFVSVKTGDNLYEKLGALEIVVKDGTVQDIRGDANLE
ncbi:MAG: YlqD family protein [Candidatus Margulisiibacteriota bacterium]|jgi:F0F1-type ATP synthase membrane subunit b/b'